LFNQLLQVTATAVEDLDNLLLLRGQGPATRSPTASVPSRILFNQLLQVTATAVEDLDNLLLLRGQGPATRSPT
ncbi:hypothetical protein CKQ90_35680, partial [Klebsiella pneumoniae]